MSNVEWLLREATVSPLQMGEVTRVDDDHWCAVIERLELGPGLRIFLTEARVHRALTVEPRDKEVEPWLGSNVIVAGQMVLELPDGQKSHIARNRAVFLRSIERVARYRLAAPQRIKASVFGLREDRLLRLFDGKVPRVLRPLIEQRVKASRIAEMPASQRIRGLAADLFAPKLNGSLRRLFQEGVVLQLLAEQVAVLEQGRNVRRAPSLTARERAAVLEARDRLLADMRAPPTLGELAVSVGLTERRLNAGFRALFGATVFEVLRNERLEHARIALESGDVPLKRLAFRVGYNHASNFISAFKTRYGAPPRQFVDGGSS